VKLAVPIAVACHCSPIPIVTMTVVGLKPVRRLASDVVTASWVVAGIDRIIILSLYQSAVYNETKYRRLRLSCCNKLLTISQPPRSA